VRIKVLAFLLCIFLQAGWGFAADIQTQSALPEHQSGSLPQSLAGGNAGSNSPTVISPEVSALVELSSCDINRLVCPADIKDVIYSKEKGIVVRIAGKNAFVKFSIRKEGEKEVYSATPTDLYVVCGEKVFNLIAVPKRIPAKTVMLSGADEGARKNISLFAGMPFEKKILGMIRSVYTENIPDSFTVKEENRPYDIYKGLRLTLRRTVSVEGEGIFLKEFIAEATENMKLQEKDFLRNELTSNPVAVSIDRLKLTRGQTARIIIAERVSEKGGN
jgi:conjugal transfer pilus assembly protein TraK